MARGTFKQVMALAAVGAASGAIGYLSNSPQNRLPNPAEGGGLMHLVFLRPNQAWVFLFGDQIIQIGDWPRFFETRKEAVRIAKMHGLLVDKQGRVSVERQENPTGFPLSGDEIPSGPKKGLVVYRPKVQGQKRRPRYYLGAAEAEDLESLTVETVSTRHQKIPASEPAPPKRKGKRKAPPRASNPSKPADVAALVGRLKF